MSEVQQDMLVMLCKYFRDTTSRHTVGGVKFSSGSADKVEPGRTREKKLNVGLSFEVILPVLLCYIVRDLTVVA